MGQGMDVKTLKGNIKDILKEVFLDGIEDEDEKAKGVPDAFETFAGKLAEAIISTVKEAKVTYNGGLQADIVTGAVTPLPPLGMQCDIS